MNRTLTLAALIAAAALAASCNRPNTAYNNSGKDATPAEPAASTSTNETVAANPAPTSSAPGGVGTTASSGMNMGDNAHPPLTAAPDNTGTGNAAGAVNETVTTGKIKAAIAADSAMKDSDISVATKDGVVTLSGTVKSQDQIAIATNLAQRQEGVQRVESNITVR